jgi:hypothetical protein
LTPSRRWCRIRPNLLRILRLCKMRKTLAPHWNSSAQIYSFWKRLNCRKSNPITKNAPFTSWLKLIGTCSRSWKRMLNRSSSKPRGSIRRCGWWWRQFNNWYVSKIILTVSFHLNISLSLLNYLKARSAKENPVPKLCSRAPSAPVIATSSLLKSLILNLHRLLTTLL